MVKRIIIIVGVIFLLFTLWYYVKHPLTTKVIIRDHPLYVDVAVTATDRQRGLSGRKSLSEDGGMLFVYDAAARHGFWMRGMNFPLDFIWLRDKSVVELTRNVPPPLPGEPIVTLEPSVPVNMVLEVNAGTIDRIGIQAGDTVKITQ